MPTMHHLARTTLAVLGALLALSVSSVFAQSCSATGSAATGSGATMWLNNIAHQGKMPYNGDSGFQVFRNVKSFGAKGDGVTDDTAAINSAISSGNGRCGNGNCPSSSTAPALVYFPPGTYKVSSPIVAWYYTQLIGDAINPPTILASSNFAGIAVIDADPYGNGGNNWYTNQNNFYRSVRNFVIDLRQGPSAGATAFHWQVSQATSLMNIRVEMGTGSAHQGMFMENGSGGFMGDLIFNGGKFGIWVGNQQFTVRNITVNNAATAIYGLWNWGWTFQGVTINNCQVGFDLMTGGTSQSQQTVGGEAIIDAVITNTPIGIRSSANSQGVLHGSLVLNNVKLNNVPTAIAVTGGTTVLAGTSGSTTIANWIQGNVYKGTSNSPTFQQASVSSPTKDSSLLDSAGRIFGRVHPQYETFAASQFVSIRSLGAKGDGVTDDTTVIQNALNTYGSCGKIIYFDHGVYYVTKTLTIPPGSRLVGEVWPVILGGGSNFQSQSSPQVVIKVGSSGQSGTAEITDIIFSTRGPAPGAILMEWNIKGSSQGAAGMWDSHLRIGGTAGTNLQSGQCPTGSQNSACLAAFMGLHLTSSSSAYLEGTWVWTADHDVEATSQGQVNIFSGRGILSQSQGPVWMVGTASEHFALYQYSLVGAKNHYMGLIQTETPYYQPNPTPPTPFSINSAYSDPTGSLSAAWGLWVASSSNILVFGAGHYSFFDNYSQDCLTGLTCQNQIVNIDSSSTIAIYSLSTVGTTYSLSVNQAGVIPAAKNPNGFQQTVTSWTRS